MLDGIRLRNYRAYEDTGDVKFSKLNIFIGANNAGKSSFASAVELFFRASLSRGDDEPLPLSQLPLLSSFDSVLRQHWGPNKAREHTFFLDYVVAGSGSNVRVSISFVKDGRDNSPIANEIVYELPGGVVRVERERRAGSTRYVLLSGRKRSSPQHLSFNGLMPYPHEMDQEYRLWADFRASLMQYRSLRAYRPLEIVSPSRPIPRSVYVLDDPSLGVDDKELVSYLTQLYSSGETSDLAIRARLSSHFATLGLATDFQVVSVSRNTASKIVQFRIAPRTKRQKLTIADVGFGASQVLPLVVKESRLTDGVLIAYQPEVHLHPFAQSRLADIFASSIRRGNQLFIETHSQDLILRLQLLLAEGTIKAHEVRVFCFENSAKGSSVRPVSFGTGGIPVASWPAGFLDTSITLARQLTVARLKHALPPGG